MLATPLAAQAALAAAEWQLADPALQRPEQLREDAFRPMPALLGLGYRAQALWIRLRLPTDAGGRVLQVRPSFLDHIEVWLPDASRVDIGDRAPLLARSLPLATPNLVLPAAAGGGVLYLRIRSHSSLQARIDLLDPPALLAQGLQRDLWVWGHLLLMGMLLLWALGELRRRRDGVLLAYLPYQLLSIAIAPALLGHFALFWPQRPALADGLTTAVVMAITPAALWFHRRLLASLAAPRGVQHLLAAALLAWLGCALLLAAGAVRLALAGNALVVAFLVVPFLWAAVGLRADPLLPVAGLRLLYLLQAAGLGWQMAPLLGWQAGVAANLYGSLLQGLLTALLVFVLLRVRTRRLVRQEQAALAELAEVRQRAAFEREQREQGEIFLSMLAHELRTPLSVVALALAQADGQARSVQLARAAVADMGELIGRCLDLGRLERQAPVLRREPIALAPLVEDLRARLDAGARLQVELAPVPLQADPQWLPVVLRNLLDNALRYSPADSPVALRVAARGDAVEFRIDNRIAGSAPDPARVFERYYRGPAALSRSGAGLGLYLVRLLTTRMGGGVEWSATEAHASIRLWLPR